MDVRRLLFELILSDGAELERVSAAVYPNLENLQAVLAAAPRLQAFNTRVMGRSRELLPVLRSDPPYGPMQVSELLVFGRDASAEDLHALAAAVAAHESLEGLDLYLVNSARELNALVDAAAERRVSDLQLDQCVVDDQTVPALARLLQLSSLTNLDIVCADFPHEESVPVLCTALRACHTLTHLKLCVTPPDGANRHTVKDLIDAAAELPALCELDLCGSKMLDHAAGNAAGRALGALLRADLPSFHTLIVNDCQIGQAGLVALLNGLAANTHLRKLEC